MRKIIVLIAAMAMLLALGGNAFAYTLPTDTEEGWVGKGEVQTAFGWNNNLMQERHEDISFRYDDTVTYSFDCTWETGPVHNRKTHTNTKTLDSGIQQQLGNRGRITGQFTGWFLLPADLSGGENGYPTDADCGAEGNEMKSIVPGSVELVSSTGGLYAVHPIFGERLLP